MLLVIPWILVSVFRKAAFKWVLNYSGIMLLEFVAHLLAICLLVWKRFWSHSVFPVISQSVSLAIGAAGDCEGSEWGVLRGFAFGWLGRWPAAGWVATHLNQEKCNKNLETRFLPECIPRHWHHSSIFYLAVSSDWYSFSASCSGFQSKAVSCEAGNTIFCRAGASPNLTCRHWNFCTEFSTTFFSF